MIPKLAGSSVPNERRRHVIHSGAETVDPIYGTPWPNLRKPFSASLTGHRLRFDFRPRIIVKSEKMRAAQQQSDG